MSQILESPLPAPSTVRQENPFPSAPEASGQSFDVLNALWRWKWLPILGAILGAGLGYLHFARQPMQYQARALIRVIEPISASTQLQAYNPNEVIDLTRSDESLLIRSKAVLELAVRNNSDLLTHEALRGKREEQVVAMLHASKNLIVQPAAKDTNTMMLNIQYICNDADLAPAVVNAVVDGYGKYLSQEYTSAGNEIHELLTKAETRLSERYKEINQRSDEFKDNTRGIIWTGDGAEDPYAKNYARTQESLSQIQLERNRLASKLQIAENAILENRQPEQILMMLSTESESSVVDGYIFRPLDRQSSALEQSSQPMESEAARLRITQLSALKIEEGQLLQTVGEGHPSVSAIRTKIAATERMIEEVAKLENKQQAELEEWRQKVEDAARVQADEDTGGRLSIQDLLNLRIAAFKERVAAMNLEEIELKKQLAADLEKSHQLQRHLREAQLIDSQLGSVKTMLDSFKEKLDAVNLLPAAGQRTLKVLDLPSSGSFYGPRWPPYLLAGAAIGFIVLSGLAILMDLADRSYRSPDEIAADLGMPVLGHVPVMDISKVKKVIEAVDPSLSTIHHSRGRVSEAFRAIRTGLFFSNRGSELRVIQVTSPVPGDGKSTLSSNLAVTMAQSGRRVLLIDADFRRPRIAKLFGIDAEVGMAQVVANKAELEDATYVSSVANLSIMPGGKRPSNPAELLSSSRFHELMEVLREKYDIIIVDTPPLLAVSDPGAVAAIVDGVVLTMRLRRNVKPLATRATRILESVDARLLGVVVNGVSAEAGYGYSYGYNDYRYAYRYGGDYRYGYKYGYRYGNYGGYIDDRQESKQKNTEA